MERALRDRSQVDSFRKGKYPSGKWGPRVTRRPRTKRGLRSTRRIITSHVSQEGSASRLSIGEREFLLTWQTTRRRYTLLRSRCAADYVTGKAHTCCVLISVLWRENNLLRSQIVSHRWKFGDRIRGCDTCYNAILCHYLSKAGLAPNENRRYKSANILVRPWVSSPQLRWCGHRR